MALKIGTLEADITANTTPLKEAEREWKRAGKGFGDTFQSSGRRVGQQFKSIGARARQFVGDFRPMKGAVRQVSYQLQDFAVQVGAGTNAMQSFSQQAPQLLSVFGPGGAVLGVVVGVATALGASLIPALFSTKDAMEELEATADELDEILNRAADGGVENLTTKILRLATASREAAQAEIQGGISKALASITTASEKARDAVAGIFAASTTAGAALLEAEVQQVARRFNITTRQARELGGAIQAVNSDASSENVAALQTTLDRITDSARETSPEMATLANNVREFSGVVDQEGRRLSRLREVADDLPAALRDASTALADEMSRAIGFAGESRAEAIRRAAEEARAEVERTEGLIAADRERLLAQINENERVQLRENSDRIEKVTQREIERRAREQAAVEAKAERELKAQRRERARVAAEEERGQKGAADLAARVTQLGETDIERIRRESAELRQAVLEEERFTADSRADLLRKIDQDRLARIHEQNNAELDATIKGVEARQRHEEAAMQRQATMQAAQQSAALQGLTALGDAANDILETTGKEGSAIAKAIFLAQKAIQVAQIIAATEVAAANAAAVAALGGPVSFFSTQGAVRAAGYASAALVGGLAVGETFGGGRQFGGTVGAQSAHPINEAGIPEVLNMAGRQYLLPTGKSGSIEPLTSGSTGAQPSVTLINNGTPQEVEAVSVTRDEMQITVRDAVQASERRINASLATGRGDTARSLQRGFRSTRNLR